MQTFKSKTLFLSNLSQTVCVRQAQGYCCVQYQLCADQVRYYLYLFSRVVQQSEVKVLTGRVQGICGERTERRLGGMGKNCPKLLNFNYRQLFILSTFYKQLLRQYSFAKKIQSQNVSREKLQRTLLHKKGPVKC